VDYKKENNMLFEIGKCYEHITGVRMKILCEAETTQWGNTLIAEEGKHGHGLISVANDIDCNVNWTEITEDEWMTNFS